MFKNLKNKLIFYQNNQSIKNKIGVQFWLDIYNKNKHCEYEIIKERDGSFLVNVLGDVDLSHYDDIRRAIAIMCGTSQNINSLNEHKLSNIPFKFGVVDGYFDISYNHLIDLDFLPKVITKDFLASHNDIVSINIPEVHGKIDLSHNKIQEINLDFCLSEKIEMAYNEISSIEVSRPLKYISCMNNQLKHCHIDDCETVYICYNPLEKVFLPKNCIKYNFENTPFYSKNFQNKHVSMDEINMFFEEKLILEILLIDEKNKKIKYKL